ncbi:DUF305 domain-containing protein [Amycolatopsis suaedae]|uniref:DUF305 domain-containing protein n=1 Tax=Amycolatopsis suaedae TaxID=2510978 RepID=A0A4Q7J0Q0_9PSEU|nr:DUF305 domain-containing protein [Amycolatopsis suaedae]RZQ59966.1 DUF305 domain-containing protein [Amycolatopsis suaedae]
MRLLAILGLLVTLLAGCWSEGKPAHREGVTDADIRFSLEMIPHHEQTLRLAELAGLRSADEVVTKTAEAIARSESAEIQTMKSWLAAWQVNAPAGNAHAGHAMPGMLTEREFEALDAAGGTEFDRLWMTTLAKHLRAGVQMAKDVQVNGTHEGTKALAREIVTAQEAKLSELESMGRV